MIEEEQYSLGELDRRLGNVLRFGTVSALDAANALVKVNLGELVTDWLPWLTFTAGGDRFWNAPEVGEQVVLLSAGDPSQGVVIGSLFQTAHPANGNDAKDTRITFADGTVVQYDRTAHQLTVDTSASSGAVVVNAGSGNVTVNCASATVNASDSVTLDTPSTHCTGNLQVDGSTTVTGAIVGQGGMAISGGSGATVSGSMAITGGDVTADGISLTGHSHMEQGDGAPVGPPM